GSRSPPSSAWSSVKVALLSGAVNTSTVRFLGSTNHTSDTPDKPGWRLVFLPLHAENDRSILRHRVVVGRGRTFERAKQMATSQLRRVIKPFAVPRFIPMGLA